MEKNLIKPSRDYLTIPAIPESVWKNPLHFIAFGFGVGTIPFAPGTFGTLLAVPFYIAVQDTSLLMYSVITLCVILASIWICGRVSKEIGVNDHQGMCLDEAPGFFVTMIHAPHGITWLILGFILFRLFDIWKPQPVRYIDQHFHGGVGMIMDDVLAGVYACIVLQLLALIF